MEGSRSERLVSLQFQNQSVRCHLPPSQQVWWHMMGEGSWLWRAGWAWPADQWCVVVGVIGGWRVHPAFRFR